jgi:hypothetical protein
MIGQILKTLEYEQLFDPEPTEEPENIETITHPKKLRK